MAISKINSKSLEDDTVLSADIADDSIIDADIKSDAAISQSKLVDVVDADINASAAIVTSKLSGAVTSITSHGLATSATTDTTNADNISSGTVDTARLGTGTADNTKFLRGDNTWQVVAIGATQLDLPIITGTLSVLSGGSVTHTITNWSDDLSWTITPTNCTVGSVNGSGEFVVTHTSGVPSYTIVATTASLGLADSNTVTKNITITLTAPTISSPADVGTAIDVIYTITSTTADDDKLILNPGTANFTFVNVSGGGTASHVGNTVECVGFTTNNPVVTIQFTAQATYSVTATSVKIDGSFGTSAASNTDNITIANRALTAPSLSSPADVGTATDVVYTITSNDAEDNKLILDPGTANFTYQGVSGATASKVGNTVECVSFGASNPVVTIQFTAEATYSVTATAVDTASYYGTSAASSADSITIANFVGMVATGGSVQTSGDYKIHTFTSSAQSPFTVTTLGDLGTVEFLLIGGGGAGGYSNTSGGGGAGGYATAATGNATTSLSVQQATYAITIGGGGPGTGPNAAGYYVSGTNGGNSTLSGTGITTVTCLGGGGGGARFTSGGSGGSGGGCGYVSSTAAGTATGGNFGSEAMGHNGGNSVSGSPYHSQGGGGGASAAGVNGISAIPAAGGAGRYGLHSSNAASTTARAGGGGGVLTNHSYPPSVAGGAGGLGGGGFGISNGTAANGLAETGSGGGGVCTDFTHSGTISGSGAGGICIIKYKYQ